MVMTKTETIHGTIQWLERYRNCMAICQCSAIICPCCLHDLQPVLDQPVCRVLVHYNQALLTVPVYTCVYFLWPEFQLHSDDAIIISGTLERELCVVISPVPGSALGMVLYICEKMWWKVPEYMPVPSFRYSLLKETHVRCASFKEK